MAVTTIEPIAFGMMWRQMIRLFDAPSASAASTYSFSRSDMNSARMMRDVVSHDASAMINARMKMLDEPKRRPSTAATSSNGIVNITSTKRMMTVSVLPRNER